MDVATKGSLQDALKKYFGFDAFKGTQKQIIENVLEGNDTVVIMPTGGGKSLCYQLPAIICEGTAIIISPLIALMKNQVDLVRGYSSNDSIAHFMNSSLSRVQLRQVKQDLLDGKTKMLYIAPETLTKEETIEFFRQIKISFVAIDEAHCISEWGHDFRPEYRKIKKMIDAIDETLPYIALTATATPKVQEDIIKTLQLEDPKCFISSFNRANLYYEVRPKGKKEEVHRQIIKFIKKHPEKSGIIYCLNRKTTEDIAEVLRANDIKASAYHAGLDAQTRSKCQDDFLMEEVHVIVATIAFGMGIDKPDVRFVIHFNMPKSLENYYQETGRAGRDGMEGKCIGFFSYADMTRLEKFMRDKNSSERDIGGQHIEEVVNYSELSTCRRTFLLNYFGEQYGRTDCGGKCDNCLHPKERIDAKNDAAKYVGAVMQLQENFNTKYIINFLRGGKTQEIQAFKHDQLSLYGKGKDKDINYWQSINNHAILQQLVKKDIERYGIINVTELGKKFVKTPTTFSIALNRKFDATAIADSNAGYSPASGALDPTLLKMLKDLRKQVAKKKKVPTYVVFQDRSLEEMATYYPINKKEMERIHGVSAGKVRKYGRVFYETIEEYVEENDIERISDLVVKSVASSSKDKVYIIRNIDKRIPLETIRKNLNLSTDEFLDELEKIVDAGTTLNIDYHINDILDEEQQEEVFEYLMESEKFSMSEALGELNEYDDYTEEDIRIIRIKFMSEVAH